jgi:hypothetical protein
LFQETRYFWSIACGCLAKGAKLAVCRSGFQPFHSVERRARTGKA